tara:strand:+ start:1552 stop:1680 length:129 start_codon:yes stop_codon:yes gene_type:complete
MVAIVKKYAFIKVFFEKPSPKKDDSSNRIGMFSVTQITAGGL